MSRPVFLTPSPWLPRGQQVAGRSWVPPSEGIVLGVQAKGGDNLDEGGGSGDGQNG